jgi:hypothetical protein
MSEFLWGGVLGGPTETFGEVVLPASTAAVVGESPSAAVATGGGPAGLGLAVAGGIGAPEAAGDEDGGFLGGAVGAPGAGGGPLGGPWEGGPAGEPVGAPAFGEGIADGGRGAAPDGPGGPAGAAGEGRPPILGAAQKSTCGRVQF